MRITILSPAEEDLEEGYRFYDYRVIDEGVMIFAVLDCRRDPSWIRERLMKD